MESTDHENVESVADNNTETIDHFEAELSMSDTEPQTELEGGMDGRNRKKKRTISCPMLTIQKQSLIDVTESHPPTSRIGIKAKEIFEELLETEKAYIETLRIIVEIFVRPMREKQILNKVQLSNVFSNVETLYEQVNLQLLKRLEALNDDDTKLASLGEIFYEFAPLFKLYAVYCSNQPNLNSLIVQLKENNEEFKEYLKQAQRLDACRKLDIQSFLIQPLQRLCKYPLLLKVSKFYLYNFPFYQ